MHSRLKRALPIINLRGEISMLAARAAFKDAERIRRFLLDRGLFAKDRAIGRDANCVFFPVKEKFKPPGGCQLVERALEVRSPRMDWKKSLVERGILAPDEAGLLVSSFDGMGDIAVMEIPRRLERKEKHIAAAFLKAHTQFKVVAKKTSAVKGKYRVKGLKVIAGEKRLITAYKESGCTFKIDLGRVYFSPRLSFERERISRQVRKGEKVLALFAGAGFYPIIIAKRQPKCEIVAIELNPIATKYMRENILANKAQSQICALEGDVGMILKGRKYARWATRIIMPLPHSAYEFLDAALHAAAKNALIHFYYIPHGDGEDALLGARKRIARACKINWRKFRVVSSRIVKTYAPHVDEVVVDFKLTN